MANFYAHLADAAQQIQTAVYESPDGIVAHPRRIGWLLSQVDSDGRPLMVPNQNGAFNATGVITGTDGPFGQANEAQTEIRPAGWIMGMSPGPAEQRSRCRARQRRRRHTESSVLEVSPAVAELAALVGHPDRRTWIGRFPGQDGGSETDYDQLVALDCAERSSRCCGERPRDRDWSVNQG